MENKQGFIKKSILTTALMLAVCLSAPVSSSAIEKKDNDSDNTAAAVLRTGEISSASAAAISLRKTSGFDAFNSLHQNRWQATFSTKTGRVKRLYSANSKAYGGSPENSAREFLKDAHMLFGVQSDLSNLTTGRINKTDKRRHIRFQQTHNGVAVQGAQIIIHSDLKGRVSMAQNDCAAEIVPGNQNLLSLEAARALARSDLSVQLGAQAKLSDIIAENMIIPHKGGYTYIWRVTTLTKSPPGLWVSHVDAQSGEILYHANEVLNMTNGKGRAYLNNDEYWLGKVNNVKLENLFETEDGKLEGLLHGEHATIYDYDDQCTVEEADNGSFDEKCRKLDGDNYAYEPKLKFVYDPFAYDDEGYPYSDQKSYFDQAAAYYQHTAVWEWWDKNVIKKYGPENIDRFKVLSVPVTVNIGMWDKDGNSLFCNGQYWKISPYNPEADDLPGFAYSDDGSCTTCDAGEDLVNDNDIVRHEYAHAIMDWAGFMDDGQQFGGEVNGYGRSMGEGNSDWYAFLASNKPDFAYVAFPPYGLRTLDNSNRYPDDVDYPNYYYLTDNESYCPETYITMPEEHYTGEIWGGYLYDLSRVLKKKALKFVYTSSFYFSTDNGSRHEYPDFVDAVRAQQEAELDLTGKNKMFFKAFGTMVSRGFIRPLAPLYSHDCDYFGTGEPGSDERDYLWLTAPLKLKTEANMLVTGDLHEYPVEAEAGMVLTAQVKSKKIGMRAPIIELYTINGTRLAITDYSGNTGIKKAELTYVLPTNGMYVVRVSGTREPRGGYYKMKLAVDSPK